MQPEVSAPAKQSDKKPESAPQPQKSQDVIYVRKSTEFSFYN
jgi:hypothetical protein